MSSTDNNIGKQFKLPVQRVVEIKGRSYYVVRYENMLIRVELYDWQLTEMIPESITCRLKSVNEFDFPVFEQVAKTKEVKLIEPVINNDIKENESFENHEIEVNEKNNINLKEKKKEEKAFASPKKEILSENNCSKEIESYEHNITYYYWRQQSDSFDEWFISTGGIKRRLNILISLAEILAEYHRQNKVYKELVPEYVKVRLDKKNNPIVSITETNYLTSGLGNVFISASIAAPEVVNRWMPNTPMSDCYSFAIIVHEILSFCHPFIGDAVLNNKFTYDDAYRGRLPWIDKKDDPTNRLVRRKYDCFFTTSKIRSLYSKTFDDGKNSPLERPTIFEWIDALYDEKSHLKYCQECETEYLYFEDGCCAFCDDEPVFNMAVDIIRVDKQFDIDSYKFNETKMDLYMEPVGTFLLNIYNPIEISTRHLLTNNNEEKILLTIKITDIDEYDNISVVLSPNDNYSFETYNIQKQKFKQKIESETKVVFPKKFPRKLILSIGELYHPHRILIVRPL